MTIDAGAFGESSGNSVIIDGGLEYTSAGNTFDYHVNVINAGGYTLAVNYGLESSSNVEFKFEAVKDAQVYELGTVKAPATGDWSNYQDTQVLAVNLPEGSYVLRMTIAGNSVNVKKLGVACQQETVTPSKVTGVKAVYENGQIQIIWDDNGAAMYKIVRSDGRSGYENLTYSATAAGWTDTKNLIDAQLYYYRVIGYFKDADGNLVMGEMSDAVGVVATDRLPDKIVNVKAAQSDRNVTLTWDKADGARYYKVSRAAGATGKYYTLKYNIDPTSYTDSNVAAGLYRYKVVGYYKDVDGGWVYGDLCDTLYVTVE